MPLSLNASTVGSHLLYWPELGSRLSADNCEPSSTSVGLLLVITKIIGCEIVIKEGDHGKTQVNMLERNDGEAIVQSD